MTRGRLDYSAPLVAVDPRSAGFDPDLPIAGLYRMRLRSGAVMVGVRIWHGPPLDPDTGEELDRSHRWQATANGRPIDLERVWPKCAADPIDQREHDFLTTSQAWGEDNAPESPQANPHKRVDLLTAPIPQI
jgi:hypothetical protein